MLLKLKSYEGKEESILLTPHDRMNYLHNFNV